MEVKVKYIVERMWMVVSNDIVEANTAIDAAMIVEDNPRDYPLPENPEVIRGSERIVNIYMVT